MAKITQLDLNAAFTQAQVDTWGHSLLFAEQITPYFDGTRNQLIITSEVENTLSTVLADDAASEVSIDVRTGKFVKGNRIMGVARISDVQSDVSDYVSYLIPGNDKVVFTGICSTTQSQDYTPNIIASNNPIIMLTPEQVQSLEL